MTTHFNESHLTASVLLEQAGALQEKALHLAARAIFDLAARAFQLDPSIHLLTVGLDRDYMNAHDWYNFPTLVVWRNNAPGDLQETPAGTPRAITEALAGIADEIADLMLLFGARDGHIAADLDPTRTFEDFWNDLQPW